MPDAMMEYTCRDFADALAAKRSVPGGGGAAAYVGALGVALANMVGNFTTGKKKYAEYEQDIQRMLIEGDRIRVCLLDLVDKDAAAFEPLSRAYGIPKEDLERPNILEEATKRAIEAPVEMMHQICAAIALLEEMGEKGSRMLVSDVGCGALLCRGALESAALNVFINTKSLMDQEFANRVENECDQMLREYSSRAETLAAHVMKEIRE